MLLLNIGNNGLLFPSSNHKYKGKKEVRANPQSNFYILLSNA